MSLRERDRAGTRQRVRLTVAGVTVAGVVAAAGLALQPSPAALAAPAPAIPVGCSAGDLAAAVSGAPSGTVLALAPRCRYVLSSGLEVTTSVTIKGNGDTITAGVSGPPILLFVDAGAAARMDGLTLRNGAPAIGNEGTLTVTGSAFTGNAGAIGNSGTLTVTGSTFTRNAGAIGNGGTLTVTGSTFTKNSSPHEGGAIDNGPYASITVTGSTFSRNSSNGGGAISTRNGQGTLTDDRFTGNTAGGGGGAVLNDCREHENGPCGTFAISGSTFAGNTAAAGGAIVNDFTLTVADSTLTGNAATDPVSGYGGGLDNLGTGRAALTNTAITGNQASVDGGGAYTAEGGFVALTRTQVRSNTPDNCAPSSSIAGCAG